MTAMDDKKSMTAEKAIASYIFEAGQLKMVKRSGWWVAGIKDPESVAEHSHRTAIIGYILAKMEGANADHVMRICLFHDMPETRVTDLHKIAQRYIDEKKASARAAEEQLMSLPQDIRQSLAQTYGPGIDEPDSKSISQERILAKDADILECAFQAKEYLDEGHAYAKDWMVNVKSLLVSSSAKKLFAQAEKMRHEEWSRGLKNIRR